MESVTSTYIKEIGYDPKKGIIKIIFYNGFEEAREGSRDDYNKLKNAKSVGKHYKENTVKLPKWRTT